MTLKKPQHNTNQHTPRINQCTDLVVTREPTLYMFS